jgi:hypothetical protein
MPGRDFGPFSIVWMFLFVAGGWLLVNALVDIGGPGLRRWIGGKLRALRSGVAGLIERAHNRVVEPHLR